MRGIYKMHLARGDTTYKNGGKERGIDMEFLREILGEELFAQVSERINAHNGNEANKDKQVKLGNLGSGEYVSKGKHDALNELLNGKQTELDTANGLIAELKKGTKGNEELQGKITGYEAQVAQLQAQLIETKVNAALKVGLLAENCSDIDYVSYKIRANLKEQGKALELDENENIKGWNELLSGAKTQLPNQFNSGNNGRKVLGDNRLPASDNGPVTVTKEQFAKMGYNDRLKLKQDNEQLFRQLANK